MNEKTLIILQEAQVNTEEAIARFAGNSGLYKKFLLKFLSDDNYNRIGEAVEKNDITGMEEAAHTLKGVSGNLGMKRLYDACSDMVIRIRRGDVSGAKEVYPEIQDAYEQVCAAVKMLEGTNEQA